MITRCGRRIEIAHVAIDVIGAVLAQVFFDTVPAAGITAAFGRGVTREEEGEQHPLSLAGTEGAGRSGRRASVSASGGPTGVSADFAVERVNGGDAGMRGARHGLGLVWLCGCAVDVPLDDAPDQRPDETAYVRGEHTDGEAEEGLCLLQVACPSELSDSVEAACAIAVTDGSGWLDHQGPASMRLRGRSSVGFPKPQIAVELVGEQGADLAVNLLGMGADADWVLNGAYIDRALIRNHLAYRLFAELGGAERYAPESRACTLEYNGSPFGVYFLVERVKADDDRVDIPEDADGASFVVKLDDEAGLLDNSSIGYGTWQLVSPPSPTSAQEAGVYAALYAWQEATLGAAAGAIGRHLDLESAADFVLLQELLRNNDAYYLSIYLWKSPSSKLRFTPWDLDLTLGQPTYNDNHNPEGWVAYRPLMISRLADVPGFRQTLAERWRTLRTDDWSDEALINRIAAHRELLGPELAANFEIWDWGEIYSYWPSLPEVDGPEAEYARIMEWLPIRTAWIDAHIDSW